MDGSDSVVSGDISYRFTFGVKAGLSLRWAYMGFFCLIDAFMFHFNEATLEKIMQLVSNIIQFLSFPKTNISCLQTSTETVKKRFLMDLSRNPKADRLSRGVATALKITQCASVYSFLSFVT